jgi:hypothetical protein
VVEVHTLEHVATQAVLVLERLVGVVEWVRGDPVDERDGSLCPVGLFLVGDESVQSAGEPPLER